MLNSGNSEMLKNKLKGFMDNDYPLNSEKYRDDDYASFILHRIEHKYAARLYKEEIIPKIINRIDEKINREICNYLIGNSQFMD